MKKAEHDDTKEHFKKYPENLGSGKGQNYHAKKSTKTWKELEWMIKKMMNE